MKLENNNIRCEFFSYFRFRLDDIKRYENNESYFLEFLECRELLGVIQFVWTKDYITDNERSQLFDVVYDHLLFASSHKDTFFKFI